MEIGDGAVTGGGTVVRRDVPPGALAVSTGPQRHIEQWVLRKREGTESARAASDALELRAPSHKDESRVVESPAPGGQSI